MPSTTTEITLDEMRRHLWPFMPDAGAARDEQDMLRAVNQLVHEKRLSDLAAVAARQVPHERYSIDLDPEGTRELVTSAVLGALALGAQNSAQAEDGHWLAAFWKLGRADQARSDALAGLLQVRAAMIQAAGTIAPEEAFDRWSKAWKAAEAAMREVIANAATVERKE